MECPKVEECARYHVMSCVWLIVGRKYERGKKEKKRKRKWRKKSEEEERSSGKGTVTVLMMISKFY